MAVAWRAAVERRLAGAFDFMIQQAVMACARACPGGPGIEPGFPNPPVRSRVSARKPRRTAKICRREKQSKRAANRAVEDQTGHASASPAGNRRPQRLPTRATLPTRHPSQFRTPYPQPR